MLKKYARIFRFCSGRRVKKLEKMENQLHILTMPQARKSHDRLWRRCNNATTSIMPTSIADFTGLAKRQPTGMRKRVRRLRILLGQMETTGQAGSDGAGNNSEQIIFTRNATEAINLVAYSWGEANIKRGDKIVISIMEHHSNFVPWQQLAKRKKAKLEILDIDPHGYGISESEFVKLRGAKLVAITHASNVLGTINNVRGIVKAAHDAGAVVLVDGAQSAPHIPVDVEKMGCDFFVITGHKMLGPSGIGALYGKTEILEKNAAISLWRGYDTRSASREKHMGKASHTNSRPEHPELPKQ